MNRADAVRLLLAGAVLSTIVVLRAAPAAAQDVRPTFDVQGSTGLTIDTFAADHLARYLNPDDATGEQLRFTAGFSLAYRLADLHGPLWLVGRTRYGVRSTDVDCAQDAVLQVCQPFSARKDAWLYILRHARTLEAAGGLRWELWPLNAGSSSPAALYVQGLAGLLTVSGNGADALDQHALTAGVIVTGGSYRDSYVGAGWGRSDVMLEQSTRRLKVDAYLRISRRRLSPYVQLELDADLGRGADSIQTHVGASVRLE